MHRCISEFAIDPQQLGHGYDFHFNDTDMLPSERRFISGLIKYYKPKQILEIEVAGEQLTY